MLQLIKYVAIVIFVVVFIWVAFNITKSIATNIIQQQITGGTSSSKIDKKLARYQSIKGNLIQKLIMRVH